MLAVQSLDAVVQAIRAGEPFVVVTREDGPERAILIDAALDALGPGFHLFRLGNPLSSPLTLGRILIQLGSSDQEAADANELDAALHALKARQGGEEQVVIAVEDAETLEPEALSFLGLLPSAPAAGLPRLQLLLVGSPSLLALIGQLHQDLSERVGTRLVIGPSASEGTVACVEHGPRCGEAAREEPRPEAITQTAGRAGSGLRRADVPLVRALRRAKGTDRSTAVVGEVPTGAPPRMEAAVAIGPALPTAALGKAAASPAMSGRPASHPSPTMDGEGSEDSGDPGDGAQSVVPGMVATTWSGRMMAGTLTVLALLLVAILAGVLSDGSLSHWAVPWKR